MNSLAVKASEERGKYIRDKYHYGITCKTCQYDYKKYAMLDFINQCVDVCEEVEVESFDSTLNCSGGIPTLVSSTSNCNAEEIPVLFCGKNYVKKKMVGFEINSWMINIVSVLKEALYFEFDRIVVNGITYLDSSRIFELNFNNIETQNIGGTNVVLNIVDWLNSFNIPEFTFYPSDTNYIIVEYPQGYTWEIRSKVNNLGYEATYGVSLNQDGFNGVQTVAAGVYFMGPLLSSFSVWDVPTTTLSIKQKC